MKQKVNIIGYSGHAYVVIDIFRSSEKKVVAYCDKEEKKYNPYQLVYLGSENQKEAQAILRESNYFIAIGNNKIRQKILTYLLTFQLPNPTDAIHNQSYLSPSIKKLGSGIMIAANATIKALVEIDNGVICNTGCIIEHECRINAFAHIAPGAVLAGNVTVGERSFIGANSVVKQGITIGKDVVVGAGSVIIRDIPDGVTVVGNPGRIIK